MSFLFSFSVYSLLHQEKHTLWELMARIQSCWSQFPMNSWHNACLKKINWRSGFGQVYVIVADYFSFFGTDALENLSFTEVCFFKLPYMVLGHLNHMQLLMIIYIDHKSWGHWNLLILTDDHPSLITWWGNMRGHGIFHQQTKGVYQELYNVTWRFNFFCGKRDKWLQIALTKTFV